MARRFSSAALKKLQSWFLLLIWTL